MNQGVLTAAGLFDPTLPAAWGPLLDALADLEALVADGERPLSERQAAAGALHARLIRDAVLLLEPDDLGPVATAGSRRAWFAEAVLLWLRFARTSSAPILDTLGVRSLTDFPLDLPQGDLEGAALVRAALEKAFAWEDGELEKIERSIDHLTSNLRLKHRLTRALAARITKGDLLTPEGRVALMRSFFGPLPWRPGDVDFVMTSTSIFFCIPIAGVELGAPDWGARSEEERASISGFLARLAASNVAETMRFPAFGHFAVSVTDAALFRSLADAVGEGLQTVQETLATMVSILPTEAVDTYLVHDSWGHTWQEALHEFEWEYAVLPQLDAPLAAPEAGAGGASFGGPGAPALASAFVARDGRTELDEAALLAFAEADLRGRIQVGTSAALSEMLADVMESKYVVWKQAALPTSSLLVGSALKLDLTVGDVRRQLGRWTKPYRELSTRATRASDDGDGDTGAAARARLAASLASAALPEAGLSEAVERAGDLLWRELARAFDGTLRAEPAPEGGIRSSVGRRLLLQFVVVAAALERALQTSSAVAPLGLREPAWRDPATCVDLFTVAIARFYEHHRGTHFFRLDDAMRAEFQRACAALKAEIDSQRQNAESERSQP